MDLSPRLTQPTPVQSEPSSTSPEAELPAIEANHLGLLAGAEYLWRLLDGVGESGAGHQRRHDAAGGWNLPCIHRFARPR